MAAVLFRQGQACPPFGSFAWLSNSLVHRHDRLGDAGELLVNARLSLERGSGMNQKGFGFLPLPLRPQRHAQAASASAVRG